MRAIFLSRKVWPKSVILKNVEFRVCAQQIASIESDVFLMSEVKLYWPRIENQDKWFERIIGKFRAHRSLFGCNTTEHSITGIQQFGGVGLIVTDKAVSRAKTAAKIRPVLEDGFGYASKDVTDT